MEVAVLGLGRMGAAIAERLLDGGNALLVWNRSPESMKPFTDRGATALERPSNALERAEVAITMLSDDAAVKAVVAGEDGVLSGADEGAVIEMSTISARASAEIAEAAERAGVGYLRAPVSGNPSVVTAGNLVIIVSGAEQEFERHRQLLGEIGPNLFYVGAGERARIVKLALNLMLGGTTQLLAEALVLGERYGLERQKLLEVIGGSVVGSPYVKYKSRPLLERNFSSTFTAKLLYKDLAMALEAAHDVSVPLALTAATQQLVEGCIAAGMGDLDLSALVPRLEREANADGTVQ